MVQVPPFLHGFGVHGLTEKKNKYIWKSANCPMHQPIWTYHIVYIPYCVTKNKGYVLFLIWTFKLVIIYNHKKTLLQITKTIYDYHEWHVFIVTDIATTSQSSTCIATRDVVLGKEKSLPLCKTYQYAGTSDFDALKSRIEGLVLRQCHSVVFFKGFID